jgi:hypothetical protein
MSALKELAILLITGPFKVAWIMFKIVFIIAFGMTRMW